MIYGEPYYYVNGIPFLKGSEDVIKTDSNPDLVLIKHPMYSYVFHYTPIAFPLGTVWEGYDKDGDYGENCGAFQIRYHKEVPNIAIFKIKKGDKTINTCWRVDVHNHFVAKYNMIIKEIPLKGELKEQLLEHYCVKLLCLQRKLCIDLENMIFVFLGYKKYIRRMF